MTKDLLDRLLLRLLTTEDLVDRWWKSPNKAFDMLTPNEQFKLDHIKVTAYIFNQIT